MSRSIESISHHPAMEQMAAAMIPADQARRIAAIGRAITPAGRVRADRLEGFVEPERLPGIGLEFVGEGVASLNFPSIAAQTCSELTIEVEGAGDNDGVILGPAANMTANLSATGYVSATGIVTIRMCNPTVAAIDPGARTFKVLVVR